MEDAEKLLNCSYAEISLVQKQMEAEGLVKASAKISRSVTITPKGNDIYQRGGYKQHALRQQQEAERQRKAQEEQQELSRTTAEATVRSADAAVRSAEAADRSTLWAKIGVVIALAALLVSIVTAARQ
ncbi:hypothetical protein [Hymenobacter sp. DG01]|uniref:hypothetical protein n=1 Tax=Hymenobacter sp. DG01 TaxID=2584940 RepID=UPI00111F88DE|nr:hypothetical protein [Hymenobacter sp. DG01]